MSDYLHENGEVYTKEKIEKFASNAGVDFDEFVKTRNLTATVEDDFYEKGTKIINSNYEYLEAPTGGGIYRNKITGEFRQDPAIKTIDLTQLIGTEKTSKEKYDNSIKELYEKGYFTFMRQLERKPSYVNASDQEKVDMVSDFLQKNKIGSAFENLQLNDRFLKRLETFKKGKDYSGYLGENETVEIDKKVENWLIENLTDKEKGRIGGTAKTSREDDATTITVALPTDDNYFSNQEVENTLAKAKMAVITSETEKAEDLLKKAGVITFVEEYESLNQQLVDLNTYDDEGFLLEYTPEQVDAYNDIQDKLQVLTQQSASISELITSTQSRLENLHSEMGFDAVSGLLDSNFEQTKLYDEWVDSVVKGESLPFTQKKVPLFKNENKAGRDANKISGGIYDFGATFVQEGVNLALDATVGTVVWLGGLYDNLAYGEKDYYTGMDVMQDMFQSYAKYNYMGISDKGGNIIKENGDLNKSWRAVSKTMANMLPFTVGIILSARKGKVDPKSISSKLDKLKYGKGAKFSTSFKNNTASKKMWTSITSKFKMSEKGLRTLRMGDAAFRMTINDNYQEGLELGLDNRQAYGYSSIKSTGTAISQAVMPDIGFFGTGGKVALSNLIGNLKSATTKKAIGVAGLNYFKNIAREIGEEELEAVFDFIAKDSYGKSQGNHMFNLRAQKELIASTVLLSGSLGVVGVSNDIKNAKGQLYNQYREKGLDILSLLNDNLTVAQESLKRAKASRK